MESLKQLKQQPAFSWQGSGLGVIAGQAPAADVAANGCGSRVPLRLPRYSSLPSRRARATTCQREPARRRASSSPTTTRSTTPTDNGRGRSAARSERNACCRSCGVSVAWGASPPTDRCRNRAAHPPKPGSQTAVHALAWVQHRPGRPSPPPGRFRLWGLGSPWLQARAMAAICLSIPC